MAAHEKGIDPGYIIDLIFDILALIDTIVEVLRNIGEFLSGN